MFDITAVTGQVAGIISLVAFVPYIIAILRGETRPNRATWWIWTVVGIMLGASYYSSGAGTTIWVPVSYVVGTLVIAILSIKHGEDSSKTGSDKNCFFAAGLGIVLWWVFSSPLIALLINLIIDFIGAKPTILKAYYNPESEDRMAWVLFFVGNIVNMFAIGTWTFATYVYPIYMLIVSGTIAVFVFLRPRQQRNNESAS